MTVNMRDAYADIMNMFSDALPAAAGGGRSKPSSRGSLGRASRGGGALGAAAARPAPVFEIYEEGADDDDDDGGALSPLMPAAAAMPRAPSPLEIYQGSSLARSRAADCGDACSRVRFGPRTRRGRGCAGRGRCRCRRC